MLSRNSTVLQISDIKLQNVNFQVNQSVTLAADEKYQR